MGVHIVDVVQSDDEELDWTLDEKGSGCLRLIFLDDGPSSDIHQLQELLIIIRPWPIIFRPIAIRFSPGQRFKNPLKHRRRQNLPQLYFQVQRSLKQRDLILP